MQALGLVGIDKTYGDVRAVRGVDAAFETGEVHAVVGENGAGKSTLLKIAAGVVTPDWGSVSIEGKALTPHTAREAIRRGVGMVQQHFALVDVFTVLENVVLGAEPVRRFQLGRLDFPSSRARAEQVLTELGAVLPLDARVETLGVGDRQRLEIARVLYRSARVLILDEPTAVLTAHEAEALYAMLRRLASSGRAVVVVTHKLDEVVQHADAVTVMRRGERVATRRLPPRARRHDELARLAADVMGAEPPAAPTRASSSSSFGGPSLVVKEVSLGRALAKVSFEVRAGEIVGVAGVEGNGQRELVRVIAGLERPDAGMIWTKADGAPERPAVVFEDRHHDGLVLDAAVRDNLVLGELDRFTRLGFVRRDALERDARQRADNAQIHPPDLDLPARALSGGNQQKIVVARALGRVELGAQVLVVAHPTRGVDSGAARAIHEQILALAARRRCAVLVVSSDLDELRALSDRILVMARGSIVAELPRTATDEQIGARMLARAEVA